MKMTNLPSEIMTSILCRLSVVTIMNCKLVCKSWFDLIHSRQFGNDHLLLAKSPLSQPGILLVFQPQLTNCKLLEIFENRGGSDDMNDNLFHYNVSPDLNLPLITGKLVCSTRGLLLYQTTDHCLVLCNPITGDSLELDLPPLKYTLIYGLGVSQETGLYKVVAVPDSLHPHECYVYTWDSRSPRRIEATPQWGWGPLVGNKGGVFLNGKLYWLVLGPHIELVIYCFDLETELFTNFPPPLPSLRYPQCQGFTLFASKDWTGLCDYSGDSNIVLWLTKDMKSWSKLEITKCENANMGWCAETEVVKVFKDGDLLMESGGRFWYCSRKAKSMKIIDQLLRYCFVAVAHTPSFLSPNQ